MILLLFVFYLQNIFLLFVFANATRLFSRSVLVHNILTFLYVTIKLETDLVGREGVLKFGFDRDRGILKFGFGRDV